MTLGRSPLTRSSPSISSSPRKLQSSGVKVAPECLEAFQALKLGKKVKYIIFKLSPNNTEIVVSKTSESDDYDEFLEHLPPGECCYAVYDVSYQKGEEGQRNKICFFTWLVPWHASACLLLTSLNMC